MGSTLNIQKSSFLFLHMLAASIHTSHAVYLMLAPHTHLILKLPQGYPVLLPHTHPHAS